MKLNTTVAKMVEQAKSEITEISVDETAAQMGKEGVLVIDIRDVRELQRDGSVPGAMHCPRGMLEFWIDPESPYHKPALAENGTLILYCASAWRSALAAKTLQDMGHPSVLSMAGGFSAWKKAGLDVETKD